MWCPRLSDVLVNVVCARSVSQSVAQWLQLLSLAELWRLDWLSEQLLLAGAADYRQQIRGGSCWLLLRRTALSTGSKMERSGAELVPSSLLQWSTEKHWLWGAPGYSEGREGLSLQCRVLVRWESESVERREERESPVTICSMFLALRHHWELISENTALTALMTERQETSPGSEVAS